MIDHEATISKASIAPLQPLWIAGEATTTATTMPVEDPATGRVLTQLSVADAAHVDAAVRAARTALDGPWSRWSGRKRAAAMRRLAALCEERIKDLARVEILDAGIPRMFATKLSAMALVRNLQYYASWADKLSGDATATSSGLQLTLREPVGVVAAIFPWNVPLLFVGSKLGPALAAGNVVILKPSELASLSALQVAPLVAEAGLPPGVVQILTGGADTGRALVTHPAVDKVSFTGGPATGREVVRQAAFQLTPTVLELGGKSPNLVFEDADLDRSTMMSTLGVFGLSGQACAAGSRLLVHRSLHDALVDRICTFASTLRAGDPLDPSTMLGPLISGARRDRVLELIATAHDQGARCALAVTDAPEGGHFVGPHVFTGVTPDMTLWREEVFGPVLAVTPFDTEAEAVALANDTPYGLAAGLWTRDFGRAQRVARKLHAGVVWVNTYGTLPVDMPFGGFRQSGWGKEGGGDALADYTRTKSIVLEG